MKPILTFDIATIPDIAGIRLLHDLPEDLPDHDVAEFAFQRQRALNGSQVLPLHLQRVLAISCVLREGVNGFKTWSVARVGASEHTILSEFFSVLDRHSATLVSWNGNRVVRPVLHVRALQQGVSAPAYWCHFQGEGHVDLSESLSLPQGEVVSQDDMAKLSGFPGANGIRSEKFWDEYQRGQERFIRDDLEVNALKTMLLYRRFQLLRGELSASDYAAEIELIRSSLEKTGTTPWPEFLKAWPVATA